MQVVPWRSVPIAGVEFHRLRVAAVPSVVASTMTQVDAADEGHVVLVVPWAEKHHELLMMRATAADALVQQQVASSSVHDAGELALLLLVEAEQLRMGAPQEPSDLDTARREPG